MLFVLIKVKFSVKHKVPLIGSFCDADFNFSIRKFLHIIREKYITMHTHTHTQQLLLPFHKKDMNQTTKLGLQNGGKRYAPF